MTAQALTVGITPTPLVADQSLASAYIDSFVIVVPAAAANSIWIGNAAVTVGVGFEVVPGASSNFAIEQGGRMLYELVRPILELAAVANCKIQAPDMLPFVSWDLSTLYAVASAPVAASIIFFRNPFV